MNTIIPIASGKGGVGKTIITANLGIALAARGKTTVLVDLDLGGSNLHTCLGIRNRAPGIGNFIYEKNLNLESLIRETATSRLFLISGDSLFPGTANLPYFKKKKIISELKSLTADYVLLDLGSGSHLNTLDFFLVSGNGLIVTTPEPTSVLNAYSFLKSVLLRMLYRSFPPKSEQRKLVQQFMGVKIEGKSQSFRDFLLSLDRVDSQAIGKMRLQLTKFYPRIIINQGRGSDDIHWGGKLRQVAKNNLDLKMEYIGFLEDEEIIGRSIMARKPALELFPSSRFSLSMAKIAGRLLTAMENREMTLYEDNTDLAELSQQFATQYGSTK